jgi:acetoacetyl-CoA synthetase
MPSAAPPQADPTRPAQPLPRLQVFQRFCEQRLGRRFASYDDFWQWSVDDLAAFWSAVWDHFELESPTPWQSVIEAPVMPGAVWFPGARLNYAAVLLRHADAAHAAGLPAIVFLDEAMADAGQAPTELSWPTLRRQAAAFAARLRAAGVRPGDRVGAYLANTPQTIAAFLGCASVGAVWSVCSPDMGPVAVLDRFRQIAPRVLVAVDGQRWGGVAHDRRPVLHELLAGLPGVEHLVLAADLDAAADPADFAAPGRQAHRLADWLGGALTGNGSSDDTDAAPDPAGAPEALPFDHPLWIVYSSGTTGAPKPIVHGHGGVVLESLKGGLHNDVWPSTERSRPHPERFHWFSTTGWIMWNAQLGALLGGTTVCLFDGNPGGPVASSGRPADWSTLWRFAAAARVTWLGAGAAFYASCLKAGVEPMRAGDLSCLQAVGSTGSPLADECYDWIWQQLPRPGGRPIWLNVISGGTDFAGAFLAGHRGLPATRGEMQCRCLGAAVQAFDEAGQPLLGEVGELVCTRPMPSMPLYFWGDTDGSRYRESYFDMFPGVWRHGDWIRLLPHPQPEGCGATGAVIYGRSDATINRHGVRMGTAELYRAVEAQPEVLDSLVVDLEYLGRPSWMPLFLVLREGVVLDEALVARLKAAIRSALSPRHVPDAFYAVAAVPRTLSGKKMELPVKKLLLGAPPEQVLKRDAMANADSVDWFVALARERAAATTAAPKP